MAWPRRTRNGTTRFRHSPKTAKSVGQGSAVPRMTDKACSYNAKEQKANESSANSHNTKPVVAEAKVRRKPAAIRGPQVCGIEEPRAATQHPVLLFATAQPCAAVSGRAIVAWMLPILTHSQTLRRPPTPCRKHCSRPSRIGRDFNVELLSARTTSWPLSNHMWIIVRP